MFNQAEFKDRSALLLAGVSGALLACGVFYLLGETAFIWMLIAVHFAERSENRRLRARLRECKCIKPKQEPSAEVLALVNAGERESAIKADRKQTDAELNEAIDVIDGISSTTQSPAPG